MKQKTISELMNLGGKTAIVTGGAMGIGLGIASRPAAARANVLIADLDEKEGEKSADGKRVKFLKTDVSQEDDIKKMIETAVKEFGSLDIIVNNAGIYPQKPVSQMTKEDFDKVMSVNLRSVFLCTREASNQMISQGKGGKIINITSIDALHPSMIGLAPYDASKHGVWGFTKNSALEVAEHKIWVNAIAPGGIATPGIAKMSPAGANMEKFLEVFLAKIPMRRMGDPDDIGKVALFLASDLASYMTGSQIVVDGGVLLS